MYDFPFTNKFQINFNLLCSITPQIISNIVTAELHHFLVVKIPTINTTVAIPYNRPQGNTTAFLADLEAICLNIPNCHLMGDFNLDQLDKSKNVKHTNLLETHGFGLLNSLDTAAVTRRISGTILDLVVTNMLHLRYKISIVHQSTSDHAIVYTSVTRNQKLPRTYVNKKKFNLAKAVSAVATIGNVSEIKCANDLNQALEKIVVECTSYLNININISRTIEFTSRMSTGNSFWQ